MSNCNTVDNSGNFGISAIKDNIDDGTAKHSVADYFSATNLAVQKILTIINAKKISGTQQIAGIRISIKTKGCSGNEYDLKIASYGLNIEKTDDLLEINDVKIFIDRRCVLLLFGCIIDYEETDLMHGFVFNNPNEKGRCGCNESFYV
jgi:iron-sulfur cluster assembly protein